MFDPSVAQIIGSCSLIIVGTGCRIVYGHFTHRWKLEEMDRECQNQLKLEGVHKKRPQRQLDRPRPPPAR